MNTRLIQWRQSSGEEKFSAVFAGDFCPREENCNDLIRRAEEITAPLVPFFASADVRVLQWECAVTRSDTPIAKSGPNHRCYPECTIFASVLGIDTVLLANNHTGDYGAQGVKDTLEAFRKRNIRTAGAGMNCAEAARPLRISCNGVTCSIINAAEYEFGIAADSGPGVFSLDPITLSQMIAQEKQISQIVIAALHGGHEHLPFPSPRLHQLCRFLADCGADAVFNCHTHCPAGYEIYNSKPIIYSPGNFYFPPRPSSLPCWSIGYLPKFYFDAQGAYGLEILPYFNQKQSLSLLNEEETAAFFSYLDGLCTPLQDKSLLQKIFDAWCTAGVPDGYIKRLFNHEMPQPFPGKGDTGQYADLRNLFTCQSHHELLRNTFLLLERSGLEEARAFLKMIEAAQSPDWLKCPANTPQK